MSSTKKHSELSPAEARDAVRDIVAKTPKGACVLTSFEADGVRMHSRPMALLNQDGDDVFAGLYFVTGTDTAKATEIARKVQVNVGFRDDMRFAAFSGTGELTQDRATIERLWNPELDAYFDGGKDDPVVAVLKVTPTAVDYWDSPGLVGHTLAVAKALLPGQKYHGGNSGRIEI